MIPNLSLPHHVKDVWIPLQILAGSHSRGQSPNLASLYILPRSQSPVQT